MKCQNCNNEFIIDDQDRAFYNRISVPEPTWCPECRMKRRFMFRSEIALYWRECELCNKRTLSMYSKDKKYRIYCPPCWHSDKWNDMEYAREYDFNKPFFEQFKELSFEVPYRSLVVGYMHMKNSEYTNQIDHAKNSYLVFNSDFTENCYYCQFIQRSKEVFDSMYIDKCEKSYECFRCYQCYQCIGLDNCRNCVDSYFLRDCTDCQDCFGCVNLKSKQYHIFNKSYSKQDYFKELNKIDLGSYDSFIKMVDKIKELGLKFPVRSIYQRITTNISGNYIYESKNCQHCYTVTGVENGKYVQFMETSSTKDAMDYTVWGNGAELVYECETCGEGIYNLRFCRNSWPNLKDMEYSWECRDCSDLFGCIGLRKKQYCILNKQYTKEEYETLVSKIKKQMMDMPYIDKKGRKYGYGEFFPIELSPFCYNETIAQEYFPLTKEQALEQGYTWKEMEDKDIKIHIHDLPDHIKDVKDDIIGKIIECEHKGSCNDQCTTAFKVLPQELEFYRKMNLPLPRLCFNCRHYNRVRKRNPLKLWHRKCQCDKETHLHKGSCPNEFETTYSPDSKETVYCEDCYKREVN